MQNEKMIERWQLPYVENDNSDFFYQKHAISKRVLALRTCIPVRGILLFHRLYLFWWSELLWLALFYPSHWSTHSMAAGTQERKSDADML